MLAALDMHQESRARTYNIQLFWKGATEVGISSEAFIIT